jgi:citrate lyase subunit beta/citryl-CoA lyase
VDILRTLLFVPGNSDRMVARAPHAGADAIVIDLEDAVPLAEKRAARKLLRAQIPAIAAHGRPLFVRVNNVATGLTRDDVMAAVRPGVTGVVHPKTESAQDLRDLDVLLREAEMKNGVRPGDIATIPLIESARGVLRCEEIARASDRVVALSVGGEDYSAELAVPRGAVALSHLRYVVATVAAALGVFAIDTPWPSIKDAAGLAAEAQLAGAIGFKGKYVIHPGQVDAVNAAFTPDDAAVAYARRVIEAAAAAAKARRGAVSLEGRMIDPPVVARARAIIALADTIAGRAAAPRGRPRSASA